MIYNKNVELNNCIFVKLSNYLIDRVKQYKNVYN